MTKKKLTNEALETLLNEWYSLDQEQNEKTINEYIKQRQTIADNDCGFELQSLNPTEHECLIH